MKILDYDEDDATVVIDWGWTQLNHRIPETVLNNPDMHPEEIRRELKRLKPERPERETRAVPEALKQMVESDQVSSEGGTPSPGAPYPTTAGEVELDEADQPDKEY